MPKAILPDTDVLVDFLRGHPKAVALVNACYDRIILSPIVIAELFAGVKSDAEEAALQSFVSLFRTAPVSMEIGIAGGLYKRDYGKSHGVGLADTIIAATADEENAELKTLNTKHFPMVKSLKPAYSK